MISQNISVKSIVSITIALIGCVTISALWYQKRKRRNVPTKWIPIGKVKNLYIYPLKGAHCTELHKGISTEYGLTTVKNKQNHIQQLRDRNLAIYKEETKEFYYHAKMHLIKVTAGEEDHFMLNAPSMPSLKVKIPKCTEDNKKILSKVYNKEKIYTFDCGDEAAGWLSRFILEKDAGLRLGFHDASQRRDIKKEFKGYMEYYSNVKNEATGIYSYLASYLIINEASIEDLNRRMDDARVTASNFRPNIVVEGAKPYAEDHWKWMKIGNAIFYYVSPCSRCFVTTLDPDTGKSSQNNEPIKTLKSYRLMKDKTKLFGNSPIMGIYMGLFNEVGQISVGDTVYIGEY